MLCVFKDALQTFIINSYRLLTLPIISAACSTMNTAAINSKRGRNRILKHRGARVYRNKEEGILTGRGRDGNRGEELFGTEL